jgi:hypothetical protein
MNILKKTLTPKAKALTGLKTGVKKVGKFLDEQFIEPSRRVNAIKRSTDSQNAMDAAAGEYNN